MGRIVNRDFFVNFSTFSLSVISLILLQLWPLLSFDLVDYGYFSIIFLILALFYSLTYSIISEPWQRLGKKENWLTYGAILSHFSLFVFVITFLVSIFFSKDFVEPTLIALIISSSIFRFGSRYYSLSLSRNKKVLIPDLTFVTFMTLGLAFNILWPNVFTFNTFLLIWSLSSILATFSSEKIILKNFTSSRTWIHNKKETIKPLVLDSTLLDLSGIGTPLILLPILGIQNFATYRSISNLTSPVKLVFSGLRPYISKIELHKISRNKLLIYSLIFSFLPAVGVYIFLELIKNSTFDFGVLEITSMYSTQVALVTFFTGIIGIFYILSRIYLGPKVILNVRLINVFTGIFLPLFGALIWGIEGAINLFCFAQLIFAFSWTYFFLVHLKKFYS
jgi:hypothetical protein